MCGKKKCFCFLLTKKSYIYINVKGKWFFVPFFLSGDSEMWPNKPCRIQAEIPILLSVRGWRPLPQHRCPNPPLAQHGYPNSPFPAGHGNSLGLWFVSKHLFNHRASCAYGELSEDPKSLNANRVKGFLMLAGKQVCRGTAWWHHVGTETWAWERHCWCQLGCDSSASTALSEEALAASKNHFQTCPYCKNQGIELPIIPTARQDNSTCMHSKGRGKVQSSHNIQVMLCNKL